MSEFLSSACELVVEAARRQLKLMEDMTMKSYQLRKLSIAGAFMGFSIFTAIPASGTTVNLGGTYTYDNPLLPNSIFGSPIPQVGVNDRVGTSSSSNPYIGLNFTAVGDITYGYSLNYNLSLTGPSSVYSGESIYFTPQFTFGSGILTANQPLNFLTGFDFNLNMPSILPNINVNNFSIPNLSFGDTYLTTQGSGLLNNSGSSASLLGDGLVKIQTPNNSMSAWETGGDVIQMLGTMPNQVGAAMALADAAGFDLITSMGMDIYRQDTAVLSNWDLPSLHTTVGSENNIGDMFTYSVDTTLNYDLCLSSIYQYGGSGALTFDGPGFNPVPLATITGDPWNVGGIATCLPSLAVNVHLTYEAPVISHADWLLAHTELFELPYYPSFHPPYVFPPVGGSTPLSSNQPTLQPIPEPGTMLLLGSSLLGLFVSRRQFGRRHG
jgi:hypothetical protein